MAGSNHIHASRAAWLCVSTLLLAHGSLRSAHARAPNLDSLVGRDFWKIPPTKHEKIILKQILGPAPKLDTLVLLTSPKATPTAWHVWRAAPKGLNRYIVLSAAQMGTIPGISTARVQLLDDTRTIVRDWSFQTGWRNLLVEAAFEYSSTLETYLIVLRTAAYPKGHDLTKEYFSISGDTLRLVRMEDDHGHVVQNEYVSPNAEIGVVPDAKTASQWIGLLESSDKTDVLSALVFLGGRHRTSPEESPYDRQFRELMDNPRVQELIRQLKMSDSNWIQQAAALAATGPRDPGVI